MNYWLRKKGVWLLLGSITFSPLTLASDYSLNFKNTNIREFIDVIGRNLHRTIIVDPSVRGNIDVRSYDTLNDEQYYSLFLSVLEIYGLSVLEADSGILKVVRSKDAKKLAVPIVASRQKTYADSIITRVVMVRNVSVKKLSPLLQKLVDNTGPSSIVHYAPRNIILLTGTSSVVDRLAAIIRRIDQVGDTAIDVVALRNASSTEMVRITNALNGVESKDAPEILQPKLVTDERTNSVLISGDPKARARVKKLITQLDVEMASQGNTRVVYVKYARAKDLVSVLKGVSKNLQRKNESRENFSTGGELIAAHDATNSLVLRAPRNVMKAMIDVISQLDIRRAQVLIEALIVEMSKGDGINLGVQWGSFESGSTIQYSDTGTAVSDVIVGLGGAQEKSTTEYYRNSSGASHSYTTTKPGNQSALASALGGVEGAAVSIMKGDWTALVNAVSTDSKSNILSSPSITVMDNSEASFVVGEEVPVLTGATSSSDSSNPFQTVDRKEVGIKLKVTPQVNEGDSVQMRINQEVSNVLAADGAVDVRFGKRQLNTTVMVKDSQMLVLGGLIDERTQESQSKVPFLGNIPLLGQLFRSTSTKVEKKNLMVFIKPTIIRDGITVDSVTQRKYNYLRAEQLYNSQEDLKLMSGQKPPVLPSSGKEIQHAPEVQAFINQTQKVRR